MKGGFPVIPTLPVELLQQLQAFATDEQILFAVGELLHVEAFTKAQMPVGQVPDDPWLHEVQERYLGTLNGLAAMHLPRVPEQLQHAVVTWLLVTKHT